MVFSLNPFANIASIVERSEGIGGLSMSALTDSIRLSHITTHLLSTYPVFKAIFSPDGRNMACIKVKSQPHPPAHSLIEMSVRSLYACMYNHIIVLMSLMHVNVFFFLSVLRQTPHVQAKKHTENILIIKKHLISNGYPSQSCRALQSDFCSQSG